MIIIWIITSIVLFSIIILIHEWWHFAAARKFWVRVEEFWLWIPPRAKKIFTDKKWTLFSLNWLPIGWFVKLTWEIPNTFLVYKKNWELYNNLELEKDIKKWKDIFDKNWKIALKSDKKQILLKLKENKANYNLMNKPSWQQAIIILAWVFMNFLLAIFIFSILFFIWIKPIWINTKIETNLESNIIPTYEQALKSWLLIKKKWLILTPVDWSIADKAWIKKWDLLLSINWNSINTPEEMIKIISSNSWKSIILTLKNNYSLTWKEEKIQNIDLTIWENWKIWSYISENIKYNENYKIKFTFFNSIKYWISETYTQTLLTFKWIWMLVKKIFNPETPKEREEAIKQVSWPIWIVDFISNSISAWIIFILIIWAVISINLWVFNLLPIPALDWWRFIFITINGLIERFFWKKAISEKTEWIIHVWFFIFLIALSLLIAYNDINKIIFR